MTADYLDSYLVVDTETTGVDDSARIVEISAVLFHLGIPIWIFQALTNPGPIDYAACAKAFEVNKISPQEVEKAGSFADVLPILNALARQVPLRVGHNCAFDQRMIANEMHRIEAGPCELLTDGYWIDTLLLDFELCPKERSRKLGVVAGRWGVWQNGAHRAAADAITSGQILWEMRRSLPSDITTLLGLQSLASKEWELICNRAKAREAAKAPIDV